MIGKLAEKAWTAEDNAAIKAAEVVIRQIGQDPRQNKVTVESDGIKASMSLDTYSMGELMSKLAERTGQLYSGDASSSGTGTLAPGDTGTGVAAAEADGERQKTEGGGGT